MESIEKSKRKIQKNENNPAPCIEKKCSACCDPVKVDRFFQDDEIPVDENGNKIWKEWPELLIPEDEIDITKLKSYDCLKLDKSTGKCRDYEKRPPICKRCSCIKKDSKESIDEQHKKLAKKKFIVIKT
ncbi:MAG: YkgJ family cysteine cluster protein [Patescibacteria group bacterium]